MDHNPSPLARVTERYKKLDRWAQWATILALPLTALATLASLAALGGATGTTSLPPPPPATSAPPASTVATQAGTAGSGVVALKSHAPASFAGSCRAQAADVETAGLTAAIVCVPAGANMPGSVQYYQYSDPADMNTAFENYAGGASVGGSCGDQPGARGTYNLRSSGGHPRVLGLLYRLNEPQRHDVDQQQPEHPVDGAEHHPDTPATARLVLRPNRPRTRLRPARLTGQACPEQDHVAEDRPPG